VYFGWDHPLNWLMAFVTGAAGGLLLPRLGVVPTSVVEAVVPRVTRCVAGT
jgi:hypothetical protein